MLTSVHVFPSSRVTWMSPLFVPTQMIPLPTVDAASDSMAPRPPLVLAAVAESSPLGMPSSPLIFLQWLPPSVVV